MVVVNLILFIETLLKRLEITHNKTESHEAHSVHSYPETLPVPPCLVVVVVKLLPVFTVIFCKL